MRVMQSYVTDLSEQNEVLVKTVEELEREANDRVALLDNKLQKNAELVKVSFKKKLLCVLFCVCIKTVQKIFKKIVFLG